MLVTSRHQPLSPLLRLLPLDVLDPEAARILFAERYADRGGEWDPARDAESAGEVVEALGRLPLAIELAAARAARAETGVAALAAELREADRLGKLRDPLDPTHSVRYVLERSLDTLSATQRLRFEALGVPDGSDWPRAVVEQLLAALPPDAPAGSDHAAAADDLEVIVALSLVTLVAPSASSAASTSSPAALGVRVRLHPLRRPSSRRG